MSTETKQVPLITGVQFIGIMVMTIILLLIVDYAQRASTSFFVSQAEQEIEAQLELELTRQADLQAHLEYVGSEEYVEKWAREKAHMVRPGDQPIILVTVEAPTAPGLAQVQPQSPPAMAQTDPDWHDWWQLFFDSEPGTWDKE